MVKTTFAHVALNCRDMATIEQFYTKHFGFRRARVIDLGEDQIVFLKSGHVYLELFRATEAAPTLPAKNDGFAWPGVRHLATYWHFLGVVWLVLYATLWIGG